MDHPATHWSARLLVCVAKRGVDGSQQNLLIERGGEVRALTETGSSRAALRSSVQDREKRASVIRNLEIAIRVHMEGTWILDHAGPLNVQEFFCVYGMY